MKKHISVFCLSCVLMISLSSCSLTGEQKNPTSATESIPVIIEDTSSQDVTQNTPEGFVPEKDLKQEALEKDTNITTGFTVAGSCTYDEKSAFGEKMCAEFSDISAKDNCIDYGGQWQTSSCDQKGYQKKCKDSFDTLDRNGKVTGKVYQNTYTFTGSQISCMGISETL